MSLVKELIEYGMTQKEASVYLATLELGESTVTTIAKKAVIFRTYCYDILKNLVEKGLVTSILKKNTMHYEAVNPAKLVEILKEKKTKIEQILPRLQVLRGSTQLKPTTQLFEGKEGVKSLHLDILNEQVDHYVFGSTTTIIQSLGGWFEYYVKERVKKKIHVKVLTDESNLSREYHKKSKKELRDVRFWQRPVTTAIYIYGTNVAHITYGKKIFGVIINSEEMAIQHRDIFEALWERAKT